MKSLTKFILCTLCATTCIQQQLYPWSFFSFLHGVSKGASIAPTIESNPSYALPIIIGISLFALVVIAIAAAFSEKHSGVLFQKATVFEPKDGGFCIIGITHNADGWFVREDLFYKPDTLVCTGGGIDQFDTEKKAKSAMEIKLKDKIGSSRANSPVKREKIINNQPVELSYASLKRILDS